MGGSTYSRVKPNAREIILSNDTLRAERLAMRDLQDEMGFLGAGASFSGSLGTSGALFSGLSQVPTLAGLANTFTMQIGAGRGYYFDPAFPGLDADDSGYLVLRWPSQTISGFVTPDATNPRIDLIVGVPNMVDTDLQSRRILVDPLQRTVQPQNVFKTSNPVTTFQVVTGTPAGAPVAPNVPLHTTPLFEVYIPSASADATAWMVAPRTWRKPIFPASIYHGPLQGCNLDWQMNDPVSGTSGMSLSDALNNACFIDGELIQLGRAAPNLYQDLSANPFGSAASSTASTPYFVYLCGGRNLPQGALGVTAATNYLVQDGPFIPAVLVESLTPPDSDGYPTVSIGTPRGNTIRGACYVGLGFVFRGTSNRCSCYMDQEMTYSARQALEYITAPSGSSFFCLSSPVYGYRKSTTIAGYFEGVITSTGVAAIHLSSVRSGPPLFNVVSGGQAHMIFQGATGERFGAEFRVRGPGISSPGHAGLGVSLTNVGLSTTNYAIEGYSHNVRRLQM